MLTAKTNFGEYTENPKLTRSMPSNCLHLMARNIGPIWWKTLSLLALLKESFEGHAL